MKGAVRLEPKIVKTGKGPMLHFRKYLQNLTAAVKTEFVSVLKRLDFHTQHRSCVSPGFYCNIEMIRGRQDHH